MHRLILMCLVRLLVLELGVHGGETPGNNLTDIIDIRVVLGPRSAPHEGRLEVLVNGVWGTVCGDSSWLADNNGAEAACRMLGYADGVGVAKNKAAGYYDVLSTDPILVKDLSCARGASAPDLNSCAYLVNEAGHVSPCTHGIDAYVHCGPKKSQYCTGGETAPSTPEVFSAKLSPNGRSSEENAFVKWQVPLSGSTDCGLQGVLKLTPPCWASSVLISFTVDMETITSFAFDIGDSPSVNGYAGDSYDTWWTAEIHNNGQDVTFYHNHVYSTANLNEVAPVYQSMTFHLGQFDLSYNQEQATQDIALLGDRRFFYFDETYIGLNRVVAGGREGTGLCDVTITWSEHDVD